MKNCITAAIRAVPARLALLPLALIPAAATLPAAAQTRLEAVVVTATRFAETGAVLPFGVSVVTAEQIQAAGVGTVNEALMKLLGVAGRLDTSGGRNYTLDLRGFGATADSNQVVIVDGLRLNEADLTSAGLASIPIASVQRIEVLRGAGAVLYGEGATGGVIIVTTKAGTGAARANAATLYAGAGSEGLRETRATANLAAGGFSVDVAASDLRSDGHRRNLASSADALSASLQWSNDQLRLGARAGRDAMRSGLPGPLTAAQYASDPRQAASLTEYGAAQKQYAGIFAELFVGNWQLALDANQRDKDYDSLTFGAPYAFAVDARNTSLRARHEGSLAGRPNVFVAGHDREHWERTILTALFTPAGTRASARSSAWYATNTLTLSTGTRLSAGWRTQTMTKTEASSMSGLDDRQQAWEFGISQPVADAVTVYARVGRSFRLANVDEFSFTNPGVPLRPQTARDMEVGARWKRAHSALELRWYRSVLRDEIGYDPAGNGPFGPFGANVNFDPTRRQGLELEGSHAVTAAFDLRLHAAWRQARFTAGPYAGNDVMQVPRQTLALRADWRPAVGHTLGGGIHWVASQSPDFANRCRIPSHATVDLRYAYQWRNAELALGVANLTDRNYYTQAFGCAAGLTTGIYPEPGRSVTASLRVAF